MRLAADGRGMLSHRQNTWCHSPWSDVLVHAMCWPVRGLALWVLTRHPSIQQPRMAAQSSSVLDGPRAWLIQTMDA